MSKLKEMFNKEIKEIKSVVKNYIENNKDENEEQTYENYFPLIKLKELIEENKINLKDKYVEFLFYYLKKSDDKDAKFDYLKCSKLNDIIEQSEENSNSKKELSAGEEEEEKKVNTEPNKPERYENILKKNSKNNIIDNANNEEIYDDNEEDKIDESATEISIDEYVKQLKEALDLIKNALKLKNETFKNIVQNKKKILKSDGEDIEYILITDLNKELKSIGVFLSELKLSCLCSKYCLQDELKYINIKSLEDDLNSE